MRSDCLNSTEYDQITVDEYNYPEDTVRDGYEHPCLELKKLLSGGTFYYSTDFDLTNRLQDRWVSPMLANGLKANCVDRLRRPSSTLLGLTKAFSGTRT